MTTPTESTPVNAEQQALLDALRRNLNLLGELAIRYEVETRPERPLDMLTIYRPETDVDLLGEELSRLVQEQVRVLLLDRKIRVVGQRTIYQGNGYCGLVRPAEVFRPAVIEAAPQIVVWERMSRWSNVKLPSRRSDDQKYFRCISSFVVR